MSNSKMESSENPAEQLRIVLMGRTGVGKSATGNTILCDKKAFVSQLCGSSVTTFCTVKSNSEVKIIDTPGFFDTDPGKSNDKTKQEVTKSIGLSSPGAHAFIVVISMISRFTDEEAATIELIKSTFGKEIMRYMIILFVGKDELEFAEKSTEIYLKEAPATLSHVLRDCNNGYIVFNNRAGKEETSQQSRDLMDRVRSIVDSNGGKCYSDEVFKAVEKELREEENKRVRDLKNKEKKEIDAANASMLRGEMTKMQLELKKKELALAKAEGIAEAKTQLLKDIESGKYTVKPPENDDCTIL